MSLDEDLRKACRLASSGDIDAARRAVEILERAGVPPERVEGVPARLAASEWLDFAAAFEFQAPSLVLPGASERTLIERRGRAWVVTHGVFQLNKRSLRFEMDPTRRDERFLRDCRYRTRDAALRALARYARAASENARKVARGKEARERRATRIKDRPGGASAPPARASLGPS